VDSAEDSVALQKRLSIDLPLLSDPDLSVIMAWGVAMAGRDISVPATFVVRRDRSIAFRYLGEDQSDRPTTSALLDHVEAAR